MDFNLIEGMERHIGQTVTVFTTSGGLSGSGFTGVLISIDPKCIRLLCDEGAPPACAVGSSCCDDWRGGSRGFNGGGSGGWGSSGWGNNCFGWGDSCGCGCGCGGGSNGGCGGFNPFGAVAVIPVCAIAAFVHHAI